ncbi:MAG: 50S ribosomal protein L10 [Gammaproteobacteria bacterium]
MLSQEAKQAIIAEVADVANQAPTAIAAEYSGLTVAAMTDLRTKARAADVYVRVVRNTLAKRALADTKFACMQDGLVGPLLLAFSKEDPSAVARIVRDFSKQNNKLVVKMVALEGQLLDASAVESLANLPTKDEAISKLMALMLAPVTQLARTLAAPHTKLVRTVAAVKEQKQAA